MTLYLFAKKHGQRHRRMADIVTDVTHHQSTLGHRTSGVKLYLLPDVGVARRFALPNCLEVLHSKKETREKDYEYY